MPKVLVIGLLGVLVFAGCSTPTPTPRVVVVTPTPLPTATPRIIVVGPTPTATPLPTATPPPTAVTRFMTEAHLWVWVYSDRVLVRGPFASFHGGKARVSVTLYGADGAFGVYAASVWILSSLESVFSEEDRTTLPLTEGSRPDTVIRAEAEVGLPSGFSPLTNMNCYVQPNRTPLRFGCDAEEGPP